MEKEKIIECINFFNRLSVYETDETTEDEKNNQQKVVVVQYQLDGKIFTTKRLYYSDVHLLDEIKNKEIIENYFGEPVFWLDLNVHKWPKGSGESDLDNIVIGDIVEENDEDGKVFFKTLANNQLTGFIQRITQDGRSNQYYHNLENNNHWHDLINLIKAAIDSKGNEVDKKYFSRLVFKWDGTRNTERERSTLTNKAYWCDRSLIDALYKNIKSVQMELANKNIISLLTYKKQIILQGPPGTGKTKLAKEIAAEMIGFTETNIKTNEINSDDILNILKVGTKLSTIAEKAEYEIIKIDIVAKTVKIKKSTEKEDDITFSKIIELYKLKFWTTPPPDNYNRRAVAIAKYIYDQVAITNDINNSEQFKLIQFHPSYSYEDFVRGIVAKPNEDGEGILYKAENKLLGEFAKEALENYIASSTASPSTIDSKEISFKKKLNSFIDKVQTDIDNNGEFIIGYDTSAKIVAVVSDGFIYSFDKRKDIKYKLLYSDLIKIFNSPTPIEKTIDVRDIAKGYLEMIGKHPYYFKVFKMIESIALDAEPQAEKQVVAKKYVLIIDEINRANLSSVLGELIYALEYRNKAVESMYAVDGVNKLILPDNLYIIGTMNTADRSVGHIDYAIRRRFAFVDVLPTNKPIKDFAKPIFEKVSTLFIKNYNTIDWSNPTLEKSDYLAADFKPEEIWLGHSYFITKEKDENGLTEEQQLSTKLKYEVVPILKEYVKDGILLDTPEVKNIINGLS